MDDTRDPIDAPSAIPDEDDRDLADDADEDEESHQDGDEEGEDPRRVGA